MLDELRKQSQDSGSSSYDDMEEVEIIVTEVEKPEEKVEEVVETVVEAAQEAVAEDSPNFLKEVEGIGPTYAKRIFASGIRSMSALAAVKPADLAEVAKIKNTDKAADWIKQAKKLAK